MVHELTEPGQGGTSSTVQDAETSTKSVVETSTKSFAASQKSERDAPAADPEEPIPEPVFLQEMI